MKSNYVVRAIKFMESFVPYMRQYPTVEMAVRVFNVEKHRKVQCCHGAVRRVLVTSDYVVKWDYDHQNSKCFGGCRDEYKRYKKVKDSDYAYLFAEITPIKVKGRTYYVMPRVERLGADSDKWLEDILRYDEHEYIFDVM